MVAPKMADPKMIAPATREVFAAPTLAVAPIGSLPSSRRAELIPSGVTVALRPGDSLWKLSRLYLGSGARWREWLSSNSEIGDPRHLRAGLTLVVPQKTEKPSSSAPAASSSHSSLDVVVRSGDSLWKISAAHYSRGALWPCVAQANAAALRGNEMIHPGQVLLLPAACGVDATPLRFAAR
jgi:nucleoid-associated protein YgaU